MTASRLEKIQSMLAEDPEDRFLRYSFAMESEKAGSLDESEATFRALMEDPLPYVPAFFMLAQQLVRRDRVGEARAILREGIEHARQQGEAHAAGEMSEFLASLGPQGG